MLLVLAPQPLALAHHALQRAAHRLQLRLQRRLALAQLRLLRRALLRRALQRRLLLLLLRLPLARRLLQRRLLRHVLAQRARLRLQRRPPRLLRRKPAPALLSPPRLLRRPQLRPTLVQRRQRLLARLALTPRRSPHSQRRLHRRQPLHARRALRLQALALLRRLLQPCLLPLQTAAHLGQVQLQRGDLAQQRAAVQIHLRQRDAQRGGLRVQRRQLLARLLDAVARVVVLGVQGGECVCQRLAIHIAAIDLAMSYGHRQHFLLLLADVGGGEEVHADAPLAIVLLVLLQRLLLRLQLLPFKS